MKFMIRFRQRKSNASNKIDFESESRMFRARKYLPLVSGDLCKIRVKTRQMLNLFAILFLSFGVGSLGANEKHLLAEIH